MKVFDLIGLFEDVHRVFPLDKAGMGAAFAGTHSLTLQPAGLTLGVWWRGRSWTVTFNPDEQIDHAVLCQILADIEKYAEEKH